MNSDDKTPAQILLDAAQNLERGHWTQGDFFSIEKDKLCFCAHGSIQYCGSKKIKDSVDRSLFVINCACADVAAQMSNSSLEDTLKYWDIKYKHIYPYKDRNLFLAHYFAWKVGLSYNYNDDQYTTKQIVIDKLKEAARLAQELFTS